MLTSFFRVCLFFSLSSFSGRKTALFGRLTFTNALTRNFFLFIRILLFFFLDLQAQSESAEKYTQKNEHKREEPSTRGCIQQQQKLALRTNDDDTFKIY